jgi:dTDP-4-amino-4,6-dideoxygalactose transaminase
MNTKLDSIQAKILNWKLPNLNHWNQERRKVAELYKERLKNLPIVFQKNDDCEEHVYHLFQIMTSKRDLLLQYLNDNGIDAVTRYPVPIHKQTAFNDVDWGKESYPIAETLCNQLLSLPIRPDMGLDEVVWVTDCITKFFSEN